MARPSARRALLLCAAFLLAAPLVAAKGLTPGALGSPPLAPGESFRITLDGPGEFALLSRAPSAVLGHLVVAAAADPAGPQVHSIDLIDSPPAESTAVVDAHVGDAVVWTNRGNATHDVHLVLLATEENDTGLFEVIVLAGLAVTLLLILYVSRRP